MESAKFSKSGGEEILGIGFKLNKSKGEEILTLAPNITKAKSTHLLRKANALIRFHFKMDPTHLTDAEFSEIWQQLLFALDFESRRKSADSNGQKIYL